MNIYKEEIDYLYRYKDTRYSLGVDQFDDPLPGYDLKVELEKYKIIKRTLKGVWIELNSISCNKKFVLLSGRKRFAYLTKEEALESFKFRKKRYIELLNEKLKYTRLALDISNNIYIKDEILDE